MAKTVQVSSGTWRQWMGEGTRCHDTVYLPSRSRLRVCSFHSNTETKPHSPLRLRQNSANVYWFLPRPIFMHNLILIETGLSWVYRHYRIQTKLITTCSYRVFTKLVALITTYLSVRLVEFLLISTCMVWLSGQIHIILLLMPTRQSNLIILLCYSLRAEDIHHRGIGCGRPIVDSVENIVRTWNS